MEFEVEFEGATVGVLVEDGVVTINSYRDIIEEEELLTLIATIIQADEAIKH